MKGIDRADQYLRSLLISEENCKMAKKKVVLYRLNCALFNVYRTLNTNRKAKYKNFLHEVGRSWISEVQKWNESSSDDLQLSEKQTTPRGPKHNLPGTLFGDFRIHKLEKTVACGKDKRSILQGSVKCVLHIKSKVKLDTFVNSALFCFTKGLVLRNTIQWRTTGLSTRICSFCGLRLRIYGVKLSVKVCYGVEHSKHLKCLGTRGI